MKTGLKLDGPTLAGIFLGKITKWNDSAIAALNPKVTLPNLAIVAVHRADSSGPGLRPGPVPDRHRRLGLDDRRWGRSPAPTGR